LVFNRTEITRVEPFLNILILAENKGEQFILELRNVRFTTKVKSGRIRIDFVDEIQTKLVRSCRGVVSSSCQQWN